MVKVAFFGTSNRSLPILNALSTSGYLSLCITKDDISVGRHQIRKPTEVKNFALTNRVNVYAIKESISKEKEDLLEQINNSKAELGVVADFGFIIPEEIITSFRFGIINVHFSLLPKYRGASPVQFAILNGDTSTGISFQLMEKSLDTGPIIHQLTYPLDGTETSGFLYKSLFELAGGSIAKVLEDYVNGVLLPKEQDTSQATYTYSPSHPKATHVYKEDAKIDWTKKVTQIEQEIRAYNPWPVSFTTTNDISNARNNIDGFTGFRSLIEKDKIIKIYKARVSKEKLYIEEIQIEGGKKLTWNEFKNGYLT